MSVTIVNYHYVRPAQPGMHVIQPKVFQDHIKKLKTTAEPISGQDFLDAVRNKTPIPEKKFLLTFDDGYMDHFTNALPILLEEKIKACFFIPGKPILENKLLQANKIHLILAAVEFKEDIIEEIRRRDPQFEEDIFKWHKPGRFDGPQINFIKKMLQWQLPPAIRKELVQHLWDKYIGLDELDEAVLSKKLYMQPEHLDHLVKNGMTVGLHGYEHDWYDGMSPKEQIEDVGNSLGLLRLVFGSIDNWCMSYPYGDYNPTLLSILKDFKCSAAFTTQTIDTNPAINDPLLIPRFDVRNIFI